ncbi:hypothetical protein EV385_5147 [Krasilnikovia cinnamomea]|uniref:Subtilisin inhibitor-like n=1 Tax=Krasilnikovia cinnamomea TaxID=349313 RepID=A0A4Q7ZR16_9ACTN|nr:hypothetical protein [Krasilnikovia cinnamomea]RZU53244.1 hypothetical protein EV385_5147 [Krasilnikovia cinnamomea]
MRRLTYALPILAAALSTAPAPTAASATGHGQGHRGCVSVRPDVGFYQAGRVATEILTVPDSPCRTISVSHVKDPASPSDRCQTFLVGFYPLVNGSLTYTDPVTACGPRRTVLARDVPNGTRYIVLYDVDYLEQRIQFRVHH